MVKPVFRRCGQRRRRGDWEEEPRPFRLYDFCAGPLRQKLRGTAFPADRRCLL